MLHSFQGAIQSKGAQQRLLSLAGLTVDSKYWKSPEITVTRMRGFDLLKKSGKEQKTDPELHMELEFIPAGLLVVQVMESRGMRSTEWFGMTDNYVVARVQGAAPNGLSEFEKQSKTIKGGGKDCDFGGVEMAFDVVDHREVS